MPFCSDENCNNIYLIKRGEGDPGLCTSCLAEIDDSDPPPKHPRPEIGMIYNMLKAIYCQSKGDAIAANSYAVNAHEYYEQMGFDQ